MGSKQQLTVYEELLARAAMRAPKDPNDQAFLVKLFRAINDLPEAEWEEMSEAAQKWSNAAAKAKGADKLYPKVPGAKAEDEEKEPEADGDEGEDEGATSVAKKAAKKAAPAKKAAAAPAKKAAAPAAAKKAAAAPAKKAGAKEKPVKSMAKAAREIICKAPHLTVDEIIAKLEAQGYEAAPVTISTFRSDTRAVLRIAQEQKVNLDKLDFDK